MTGIALQYTVRKGDFSLSVDTEIPARGITGVFGASGAGKTTLLRCIAGLESVGGKAVHERRIAYVFQQPQLFTHLNVAGNIRYGRKRAPERNAGFDDIVDLLGLGALLDRRVHELSGGEAQRVAIARALCMSPVMILMDEPLSAVDRPRRNDVLEYLDRLRAELSAPLIYVSHSIDEICRLCDHLLILDNGSVTAEGDLQSVLCRLDVPQLSGANAGVLIEAGFAGYDDEFDLSRLTFAGGELYLPGKIEASRMRLRIGASDVSLTRDRQRDSSILNIVPVTVDAIAAESRATALVRVFAGGEGLIARITNRSVQNLALKPGEQLFAQIKSVTVRR